MSNRIEAAGAALTEIRKLPTTTPALKTLKTLVSNIAKNPSEEKYHGIKLSNPKIQERLGSTPQNIMFLKAMGFQEVQEGEERMLKITADRVNQAEFCTMQKVLEEAVEARSGVLQREPLAPASTNPALTRPKEYKKPKLSMKAQAIRDKEERAIQERAQRLADKQVQLKRIAADKHARANDPNWKAGVSAAMAKGGDSISTFRDKFGE
jgi:hypothetical protein